MAMEKMALASPLGKICKPMRGSARISCIIAGSNSCSKDLVDTPRPSYLFCLIRWRSMLRGAVFFYRNFISVSNKNRMVAAGIKK